MTKRIDELINKMQNTLFKHRLIDDSQPESLRASRCKLCGDTGMIYSQDAARVCHCAQRNQFERLYKGAGIAPELKDCSLHDFKIEYYDGEHLGRAQAALQGARNFVRDYLEKRSTKGMLLCGDVGSGKTYLAATIANALLLKSIQVLFLVVPDFLDEMRATYHKEPIGVNADDDVSLLKSVRQVEILILDDLGAHNYTEWTRNKLYSLLNYRLNYQLPVIITTNLLPKELDESLGERTTSRIVQMCNRYRLTVSKDIRYVKNQQEP